MPSRLVIVLDRSKLQRLADIRLDEAKVLLENKRYDGAYYLSGYVIELALKACIAKRTKKHSYPDLNTVKASYNHGLSGLFKTAELELLFRNARDNDPQLNSNWAIVESWSSESRYTRNFKQDAKGMFEAVSDPNSGVFTWIKQYW
jgi:HEPN domain-containing protein